MPTVIFVGAKIIVMQTGLQNVLSATFVVFTWARMRLPRRRSTFLRALLYDAILKTFTSFHYILPVEPVFDFNLANKLPTLVHLQKLNTTQSSKQKPTNFIVHIFFLFTTCKAKTKNGSFEKWKIVMKNYWRRLRMKINKMCKNCETEKATFGRFHVKSGADKNCRFPRRTSIR